MLRLFTWGKTATNNEKLQVQNFLTQSRDSFTDKNNGKFGISYTGIDKANALMNRTCFVSDKVDKYIFEMSVVGDNSDLINNILIPR